MINNYYVYHYLREDGSPYYIGKGKGLRLYDKRHTVNLPSNKDNIRIIADNLTEQESFDLEKSEILKYGRKDNNTGILRNLTNGGEGPSGVVRTESQRKIIGDFHRGKTLSESTKQKVGQASIGRVHPPRSEEVKNKLRDINKNKKLSTETKSKISEARKGKPLSAEHKKKISEARMKRGKSTSLTLTRS